ncbi:YceI family protein [Algivirga pacifica]|uniref:Lipid/polyisoprenoid-binding YceI-like domain-containing protein n=1 Tax=Algivirga pacifica TaxID=1162670 RepID=A0ABP9D1L5_9BACT
MNYRILFTLLCFIATLQTGYSQKIYQFKKGSVSFFSEAPLENIEAQNSKVNALLNMKTGEVFFKIEIRGFKFKKALMEEHFNENYMESEQYPFATFKGKILQFSEARLNEKDTTNFSAKGIINLHGVEKEYTVDVSLQQKKEELFTAQSTFQIRLEEHSISIPKLVFQNIAEVVDVQLQGTFIPFDGKL